MRTIFRRLSLLLLAAVGAAAWLQAALPESGKVYKINNIHDGWTFGENTSGVLTNVNAASTEDLKQLWVCVVKDGKYAFVNANSGKCLKAGSGSGSAWTTDTLASYFYLVSQGTQAADATYGAGLEYFAISTTQGATNQTCLHCWQSASPQNWTSSGGGSRWTFTEATTTLDAVNTNLSEVFTQCNSSAVFTNASNAAASFGVGNPYALQCTDENEDFYVSTNADQNVLGTSQDGNGIAGLIDKNYDTFLHTRYDGTAVSGAHHIQVKMTTGLSSFRFFYRTRPGGTNFANKPTKIVISGSSDGTNFTEIKTLTKTDAEFPLPSNNTSIENYISPIISSGTAYQYLRFEVTETNNNTAFFTLGEFALMAAGTNEYPRAGELTADLAAFYKTYYPLAGTTVASAVDLPEYYANSATLAAATAAVKATLTASEIATGTLADKLTYIKYHIYYTDAEGTKHYLHINDSHQLAISTTPASFAFAEGVTTDGYAAKAYYMHMGGYHPGHWETDGSGFNVDESTSNNVGIWHSQVFYFDETTGKYAIRNTNAKNSGGYQCNYFICHDDSNAPVGRVLSSSNDATAIYQWTVRPDYPFEITTDDNNPTTYLIMTRYTESGYTKNTYAYNTSNSKSALAEVDPTADAQKWYFKEVEDNGKFYVQIYSVANTNPMSYENSNDGATKIIAKPEGTSGYSSYFFLDSENGQAPYYFRPTNLANYLSNNGGDTQGMGFWNSRNDNGSKIFFTPTDLYGDFIRLKGNSSNYYADASAKSGNGYISMKSAEACSPTGSVFYLTPEGRLLSYAKGLYTTNTCQLKTEPGTTDADIIYFWARDDKDDPTKKYYILQKKAGSGSRWIYDDGGNNEVDRQNTVDAAHCNWTVEKVENLPVNVSTTAKWATLYAPVPLTIPADVDAYTASISGTTCTLTGVTGSVPANTGLILHKAGGGLTNFAVAESASPLGSTNVLSGTIETTATPSSCYTLQLNRTDASKVGLYSYNGDKVQGFRAYYAAGSSSVQAYLFSFGDEDVTGIDTVQQDIDLQGGNIYDLTGRKVNRPAKGMYIVNGRKVYFK